MSEIIDIGRERLFKAVLELVRCTACEIPDDVKTALEKAQAKE